MSKVNAKIFNSVQFGQILVHVTADPNENPAIQTTIWPDTAEFTAMAGIVIPVGEGVGAMLAASELVEEMPQGVAEALAEKIMVQVEEQRAARDSGGELPEGDTLAELFDRLGAAIKH